MDMSKLSIKINNRYKTLENNIKSKSNSYYDSYLDLLEETLKFILDEALIEYDKSKTCGSILKLESVCEFLKNQMNLESRVYDKLLDYIKKSNDHKHKKEKELDLQAIINQMQIYFEFINTYFRYKHLDEIIYSKDYYATIFGETQKIHEKLLQEKLSLTKELEEAYINRKLTDEALETYKSIVEVRTLEYLSLEDENIKLNKEINLLKDIKFSVLSDKIEEVKNQNSEILNSLRKRDFLFKEAELKEQKKVVDNFLFNAIKSYIWSNKEKDFKKEKKSVVICLLIFFFLAVLTTIFVTMEFKLYSTYTFFENIYAFCLLLIFTNILKLKESNLQETFQKRNFLKFERDKYNTLLISGFKTKVLVFLFINSLCSLLNIYVLSTEEIGKANFVIVLILELLYLIISIICFIKVLALYREFYIITYVGKNSRNENVTIYFNLHSGKMSDKEM